MAFTVDFYNFAKAQNSTKRPTGSAGLSCNCILKEGCSIFQPEIQIQIALTSAPLYNYAYIAAFDRYYFINNWTFQDRLWTASMVCDVLGSWKNTIGNTYKYILRSSFNYDLTIKDDYYPATTVGDDAIDTSAASHAWWDSDDFASNGCYVISFISGDDQYTMGNGISYLILDADGFRSLSAHMLARNMGAYEDSNQSIANVLGDAVAQILFNPFQYILTCKWYPFPIPASISGATPSRVVTGLKIGWWTFQISSGHAYSMPAAAHTAFMHNFTLQHHPSVQTRGTWLDCAPFRYIQMRLPRLGLVPIDVNRIIGFNSLVVFLRLDLTSGEAKYILQAWTSGNNPDIRELASYTVQLGVDIPLHDVDVSIANMAGEITSTAAAVATAAEGGLTGVGAAIGSLARLYEPHISMTGGMPGSFLELSETAYPIVYYEFYYPTNEDLDHVGRPLCQTLQLSAAPGYLQCLDGHIEIDDAFKPELELIENYLVNGFYYE